MTALKQVTALPDFPTNETGLERGSVLEATHEAVQQLGLTDGRRIPIGFDGQYVRCGPFTWSVDQLEHEIKCGVWKIVGTLDLSDPKNSKKFAREIEGMEITN